MPEVKLNKLICFLKTNIFIGLILGIVFIVAGCATDHDKLPGDEMMFGKESFSSDSDKHPYNVFSQYFIKPGDQLDVLFQIRTWIEKKDFKLAADHVIEIKFVHNPELNEQQTVRPDGNISLPYVGEIYVVGKTIVELQKELKEYYSKVLRKPELYVLVPEFRSAIKELKKDLHTAPRGLSRLVTVRPDGHVSFPMVGELFVVNKTIFDVNKCLNEMYEQIVPGLHVDLFLEKHSGTRIYVMGEVNRAGAFNIMKPISVVEAITLAGSYLPSAKLNSIVVVRKMNAKMVATIVNLEDTLALKQDSRFFYLQPDDIVYVPKTRIAKASEVANYLSDMVFFRGWGIGLGWDLNDD
jgi:polysaccharide export outer membrane protein